jgi:hypothetical protein
MAQQPPHQPSTIDDGAQRQQTLIEMRTRTTCLRTWSNSTPKFCRLYEMVLMQQQQRPQQILPKTILDRSCGVAVAKCNTNGCATTLPTAKGRKPVVGVCIRHCSAAATAMCSSHSAIVILHAALCCCAALQKAQRAHCPLQASN